MSNTLNFLKFRFFYSFLWLTISTISLFFTFSPLLSGQRNFSVTIMYYTNWSCWLSVIASIFAFSKSSGDVFLKQKSEDSEIYIIMILSSSIMITATFLVIFIVSLISYGKVSYTDLSGLFLHCILPIINFIYPFLFLRKSKIKFYHPLIALIPSIIYWTIIVLRVVITRINNGGHIPNYLWSKYYPYPFTNLDSGQTFGNVLIAFSVMLVVLLSIGYFIFFLSKIKRIKKPNI